MIPKEYEELIEKLKKGTTLDKIPWNRTSRENEFSAQVGEGTIIINKDVYFDFISDIAENQASIRILNAEGDVIDSLNYLLENDLEGYKIIENLYDQINRKHLKVDETIKSMLDSLDF